MKDLKYLAAFSIPVITLFAIYFKGIFSFYTPFYAFFLLPIIELILPTDASNLNLEQVNNKLKNKLFDWILYFNFPMVLGLLAYALTEIAKNNIAIYEVIGLSFSIGIVLAVNGINVAHELGHRQKTNERFLGKALLLPSLYMHFI